MEIERISSGNTLKLKVSGRLDTNTSPQLKTVVDEVSEDTKELIFDFEKLLYISSAGLRVLLAAQKKLKKTGGAVYVENAGQPVLDVFHITGFEGLLQIR